MRFLLPMFLALGFLFGFRQLTLSQYLQEPLPTVGVKPFPGLVPDERTAVAIANLLLTRYLGKKEIQGIILNARLEGKVWIVRGSYNLEGAKDSKDQNVGQLVYPVVRIDKQTCSTGITLK